MPWARVSFFFSKNPVVIIIVVITALHEYSTSHYTGKLLSLSALTVASSLMIATVATKHQGQRKLNI